MRLHFQTTKNARAAWCIKQHKVFRVFIHTGIPNRIPLNFEKGQGLARGKRKRKGNARILASKERKNSTAKIRGVTGRLGAWFLHGEGSFSGYPPFPVPVVRERKRKRIRNRMTWRTFFDAVIMAKAKRRLLLSLEAPPVPPWS